MDRQAFKSREELDGMIDEIARQLDQLYRVAGRTTQRRCGPG